MPRLQNFEWGFGYMLEQETLLCLWVSCPDLRAFRVWDASQSLSRYRPDLFVFCNLRYLAIEELFGDLCWWRKQLVQILLHSSRDLRGLELSISEETVHLYQDKRAPDHANFFDRLCQDYIQSGGDPLPIKTLKCGRSIYPMDYHYLTGLVNLASLEVLEIDNDEELHDDSDVFDLYTDDSGCKIVFWAFGPATCPRLRRLTVSRYGEETHKLLCQIAKHPSVSCNLVFSATSHGYDGFDSAMLLASSDEYPGLPIKLRMMEVDLNRENRYSYNRPAKQILEDLAVSNGDSLEALVLNLSDSDSDWVKMVDGVNTQHVVEFISSFTKLTQLYVYVPYYEQDHLEVLAERLALACTTLQRIDLSDKAFAVRRHGVGFRDVSVRPFTDWENHGDLLRFSTFDPFERAY
ncbi:hypothetical protein QBC40DRAFT_208442 [Triangularia verruculosa]|uniref:Uncharacterized protein n=1 Tax=Triangularia verruculosa TaxID=2587418 RepID=A0AAN6XA10_9PEZI|nr:hypothetical protein QBC40DRAFT_208442 [Triangularia verruculosa]